LRQADSRSSIGEPHIDVMPDTLLAGLAGRRGWRRTRGPAPETDANGHTRALTQLETPLPRTRRGRNPVWPIAGSRFSGTPTPPGRTRWTTSTARWPSVASVTRQPPVAGWPTGRNLRWWCAPPPPGPG